MGQGLLSLVGSWVQEGQGATRGVGLWIRLPWLVGNHVLPCAGKALGNLQLNLLSKSKVYEDPALSAIFLHKQSTTTSSRPWRSKWPRGLLWGLTCLCPASWGWPCPWCLGGEGTSLSP